MIWRRSPDRCFKDGRRTRNIKLLRFVRKLRIAAYNSMVSSNGISRVRAQRRSARSESSGHSVDSGISSEDATWGWRIQCMEKSLVERKSKFRKKVPNLKTRQPARHKENLGHGVVPRGHNGVPENSIRTSEIQRDNLRRITHYQCPRQTLRPTHTSAEEIGLLPHEFDSYG